ncbi:hypothetical protein [Vannielia litorea]|uniref:hypothetical protein n=1 Tax=Vannielia litorea TaxID=1217970 RepID=UPI001C93A208|nr:hypothetical protein [Vannielia litorea]MBY6046751.1 hypothetical protein [Vannielia litorea]MBY6074165.1 hypothetical protein [Vannielia litorea]
MTAKFAKPLVAVTAMSLALAAPASAQIAKFHFIAPAVPGLVKLDQINSTENALAEFVGATSSMSKEGAASLEEMRSAEDISATASQEIDSGANGNDGPGRGQENAGVSTGGNDDGGRTNLPKPVSRPEVVAAADDDRAAFPVTGRPTTERQVIVRTRTKSPRGGSKIKAGSMWSVGQFR